MRSYGNQSFAICDWNAPHNISSSLPRFNACVFDCRSGLRSNTYFVVIMAEIEHVSNEEEVARYGCVYHRNSKDFKDKNKKANWWDKIGQKFNLLAGEAEAKFRNIRAVYGRYRIQNQCFRRFCSWRRRRFMTNRRSRFACSKISALPHSQCCLLFSLHAHIYLTFPLTKTYGYGRLCDRCDYMETAFFAIVCDCLRSTIICDRLRSYGNQSLK